MSKIVSLLTDFGEHDSYVAEVKAVLLKLRPGVTLVDITHEVPPFAISEGAFHLLRAHSYFPRSTLHLAVVDPGVGTKRRCVYVRTRDYHFVGPDNGLLLWAVRACEEREKRRAQYFRIPVPKDILPTFFGRDLFAPFAAQVLSGRRGLVQAIDKLEGREFPAAEERVGRLVGEVISIDRFGNLITSIPIERTRKASGRLRKISLISVDNYESVPEGKAALIRGSHGFWEISARQESAAELLRAKLGDKVSLLPL